MENEKLENYAKVVNDEVTIYLKKTRCVNKLDARTSLAIRVLDMISKLELMTIELCKDELELEQERKASNKLRELIYESLKEY